MATETINIPVSGMSCSHCAGTVKKALDKIPGVESVSISIDEGIVTVDYDKTATNEEKIKEAISDTGYEV